MDNLARNDINSDHIWMETIEGKVVMMSPRPLVAHNVVMTNISCIFGNYLRGKTCRAFGDGVDVHLDEENTYVPDVIIVCDRSIVHRDGIYGAPDLVVEVLSPSTSRNDRGAKMRHYAAAGVKEYWIVTPLGKSVEVYLNENGRFELDDIYTEYDEQDLARMDEKERAEVKTEIPVSFYDDFRVSVKEVFEDVGAFG